MVAVVACSASSPLLLLLFLHGRHVFVLFLAVAGVAGVAGASTCSSVHRVSCLSAYLLTYLLGVTYIITASSTRNPTRFCSVFCSVRFPLRVRRWLPSRVTHPGVVLWTSFFLPGLIWFAVRHEKLTRRAFSSTSGGGLLYTRSPQEQGVRDQPSSANETALSFWFVFVVR